MGRAIVLVVDDDHLLNLEHCDSLRRGGYRVVGVGAASAALGVIETRPILSALVTDIDLGGCCNGFDVARWARAVCPSVPIIFISGMASFRRQSESFEGAEFIDKPLDPQEVVKAVGRMRPADLPPQT